MEVEAGNTQMLLGSLMLTVQEISLFVSLHMNVPLTEELNNFHGKWGKLVNVEGAGGKS